jgi:nucleotide-binding universal stress UspA family protein
MEGLEQEDGGSASPVRFEPVVVRDIAAAPAIVTYAQEQDIDLIVMGTHGRRGIRRLLLGSTAEEVVRTAPCPVLTTRPPETPAAALDGINAILVPVDFSRHARTALRHAKALAALYHTRLDLLHVIEEQMHPAFYNTGVWSIYDVVPNIEGKALEELETFYEETKGPRIDAAYHVRHGQAAHEIAVFAREQDSDLVVMATHGLRGLEHFLLGSVAEKVVRRSPVPVFTVKAFGKTLVPDPAHDATEAAV